MPARQTDHAHARDFSPLDSDAKDAGQLRRQLGRKLRIHLVSREITVETDHHQTAEERMRYVAQLRQVIRGEHDAGVRDEGKRALMPALGLDHVTADNLLEHTVIHHRVFADSRADQEQLAVQLCQCARRLPRRCTGAL